MLASMRPPWPVLFVWVGAFLVRHVAAVWWLCQALHGISVTVFAFPPIFLTVALFVSNVRCSALLFRSQTWVFFAEFAQSSHRCRGPCTCAVTVAVGVFFGLPFHLGAVAVFVRVPSRPSPGMQVGLMCKRLIRILSWDRCSLPGGCSCAEASVSFSLALEALSSCYCGCTAFEFVSPSSQPGRSSSTW